MLQKFSIALILLICTSCYIGDEVAPDQEIWDYDQPDNQGLSSASLLTLNERLQLNEFQEINGLMIIRNNKLVFENYFEREVEESGFVLRKPTLQNRNESSNIGSAGLIFALSAIGVAEDKRLLSIDDPISEYLPEYEDAFDAEPDKANITIAHLLAHRSGFSWNESIRPFSAENDLNQMKLSNDWIRYILEKPLEAPPGLRFNSNTGTGLILTRIVENASGQDFETFLQENILEPLTISSFEITVDPQGHFNAGDGISISLLDWTKLGYLHLKEGTWRGRRIIDPNFIAEATSVQSQVSATLVSGYTWRLFGDNFAPFFGVDHDEIYYISGSIGQHIYVIPSENMIVSIFAENYFFGLVNPSLNLFAEITNTFQ